MGAFFHISTQKVSAFYFRLSRESITFFENTKEVLRFDGYFLPNQKVLLTSRVR